MCGIFAYKGTKQEASAIVFEGLKKLDYRGYDSWGIAEHTPEGFRVVKDIGKIEHVQFTDLAREHHLGGTALALGHSRWATHGGVTVPNAHPHLSQDKDIVVVHNGIIENYQTLRDDLKSRGYTFLSETDTEVIPHLISDFLKQGQAFPEAVRSTAKLLHGRYAFVALSRSSDLLVGARHGSPLILGRTATDYFLASDIPAFLEYTREVSYIDDLEMVVISDLPRFYDLETGLEKEKKVITIDWTVDAVSKSGYDHFMLKEIMEQKDTLRRAIEQNTEEIERIADAIKSARGVFISGCGTAGKVAQAAQYFFSVIADRHVNFEVSSEFPVYHHFLRPESLLIVISQSGETADVLEACDAARSKGSKVFSVVNVAGSSVERISDYCLHIKAGPEKAVASTKAATAQLAVLMLVAYAVAGKLEEGRRLLLDTVGMLNDLLNPKYLEYIKRVAEKIYQQDHSYIIGKSFNYPMALEAAIKIQEVSYIHAQGFAGGELKHGPIALVTNGTPCITIVANDETRADIISNSIELKARGAYIIGIAPDHQEVFDEWISVPDAGNASPIVNLIPIQLLAYYLAVLRGNDPDKPRNLAKSVTVK